MSKYVAITLILWILTTLVLGTGIFIENWVLVGFGMLLGICTIFTAYKIGEIIGVTAKTHIQREIDEFFQK